MKARVPVDVDLEDRLIYGLTPLRLGYVVIVGMAALAVYRSGVPLPVRIVACVLLLAIAAAAGWAKYDGRQADRWLMDAAAYLLANVRLEIDPGAFTILRTASLERGASPSPAEETTARPTPAEGSPGIRPPPESMRRMFGA